MIRSDIPLSELLPRLERLAHGALGRWDLPDRATVRLINVSENATYLVEAPGGFRAVLRVHREAYHDRVAIASELAWMRALKSDGVLATPDILPGRDGEAIQLCEDDAVGPRHLVLFEFLEGDAPDETMDLSGPFFELGQIAARAHGHAAVWARPAGFARFSWDLDAVFGARKLWGDWRAAPNVTPAFVPVLERAEQRVTERLVAFGQGGDRYGLIHADMRLANLLIHDGQTRVIDFDDCGFGWFMYDFAAAISFMEDAPEVPALRAAWTEGYRSVRELDPQHEAEIDSFVMLRRMALLAWIGSHSEAPEPQALAPAFAETTVHLAEAYLTRF